MTLACEIDAKPAGNIGFLRVWVADEPAAPGDARKVLEAFMAGEKAKGTPVYTDLKAGPAGAALPAVQAAYETDPWTNPRRRAPSPPSPRAARRSSSNWAGWTAASTMRCCPPSGWPSSP